MPGQGPYGLIPGAANPQYTQGSAIGGNLSALSNLYNLATGAGGSSGAGGTANLNAALPGATGALGSGVNLALSELGGQIDQPTINNLEQVSAERGVATGSIGSPNSNAALMAALGRTTQGTEQLGMQNLSSLISSAPVGPQFNPASMLVDPAQQQEAQQYANTLAAAPDPAAAANAELAALYAGRSAGQGANPAPAPAPANRFPGYASVASPPNLRAGGGTSSTFTPAAGMGTPAAYGSSSGYGTSAGGGTMNDIPGGNFFGNVGQDENGATSYESTFGTTLPQGQSYNATTGLVSDSNAGTVFDPSTGVTYDAMTGQVVNDGASGGNQPIDYFEGIAPQDQGAYMTPAEG